MSSVSRRLHEIFTKSLSAKTKFKPKSNSVPAKTQAKPKSNSVPEKTQVKPKYNVSASPGETQLQKLVNNFKKSCEDPTFRHNQSIYWRTVRRLATAKKFSMIEDVLESQKNYDDIRGEEFANRLIFLYGESGMFEHARKLFDEMPELTCERTARSFNVLLKAAFKAKKFGKVVEIFKEFPPRVSVEPDVYSYTIFIHALCEMGSFDDALSAFHEMESNGKEPSLVTFNTLFNALYSNGRFLDGEKLLAIMESKNIVPGAITYNARLQGIFCGNAGLKADEVVSEMERKGIKPDVFSYNILINGSCDCGNLNEAKKWYDELKKNKCSPKWQTFVTLIPACCNAGDLIMAYELCLEAINHRLLLKAKVFKNVVDRLVEKVKYAEASKLVKLVNSADYINYELESLRVM